MATKRIIDLPTTNTLKDETSVLVNDNGVVKMATANAIQADWDETDETSPKFIMNKPTSLNSGQAVYVYSSNLFVNANNMQTPSIDELMTDFLNKPVRLMHLSRYNSSISLEENILYRSVTMFGFTLSGNGHQCITTITDQGSFGLVDIDFLKNS